MGLFTPLLAGTGTKKILREREQKQKFTGTGIKKIVPAGH
jgi:hypothetical protein